MIMLRTEMHQIVGTTATAVRAELHKEWLTEGGALHAHLQAEVAAVRTDLRMESQAEGLALRAQVQTETKQVLEKLDGLRQNVELMRDSMQDSLLPVCMQKVQEEVKQIQHSVSHTTIAGTNRLVDVEQRLLEKIGEVKASVDVLPKCLAVQSVATEGSSQIRDNVLEVRRLVSDLQTVGIAQIFDAVMASKTPVIDEIRKISDVVNGIAASQSFRSDVAQVMDEVQKMAQETRSTLGVIQADIKKVEAAKVIEEISRVKTEVDFTTVFRAIKAARVDVTPILTELSKLKVPEVRLGPVVTEIQKFHGDIRAIAPMVTEIHKMQGDMKKQVTTDTLTRQVLQVTEEISKLRVDLDPGQLINRIKEASKSDTASVLTALKKVTKESDLVALHSAMQDTRSDMAVLLAEMKKATVSPLLSEVQKLKVDTSPLIDEIKKVKAEIDFSTVLREIKAAQTDLAPVLSEIQKLKSMKVETVNEIKGAMTEIDFSAICKQIEASRIDVAPLMSEIQKVKAQTSPLLGEIKKVKAEIDFTSVFKAIKAAQIDVTPLLSEIHKVTTSPLTDEIRKAVAAIDFTSIFSEIKAAQIDMAPFLSEIQTVKDYTSPLIDEIRKAKTEIDFTTVLTAMQAAQIDMTPLMSEIQRVKVDVSPLSEDIQKIKTEIWSVVLNEIQKSKVNLDPVLVAIQNCQDGLQAITATTNEIRAKAEVNPIFEKVEQICKETFSLEDKFARGIQATQNGQVQVISEIQALAASQASTSDTTLGSMRAIIQTSMAASLEASMEVYMQEVRAEVNQVHQNVSQTTTAGTQRLSDVERSILEGLTEVKALVDILPNSMAVQSVQMEASSRALDNVLEVLKAMRSQGAKPMDMSPLTTEIHQMRADLKLALPASVVVPTDLNPSVVVQNVNRRGRIRFDMKTGLLTFVSSITFVRRAPSESPTATFEHPEEVRAAMGDAAEIIRLLNVPTTVVRYQLKENVDRLSITDTLQKWMQELGQHRAQLVLQTLQNQGAPVALLTAETRERSTEGIELFVRLSDNASLKY
jgi:predicted transcriptional regulator